MARSRPVFVVWCRSAQREVPRRRTVAVATCAALDSIGHDAVHTSELAHGNRTSDAMLSSFADSDDRIVVTKDRDFEVGHLIGGVPERLLLVTTGNITNGELLSLVVANIDVIADSFESARFIELSSDAVTIRGGPDPL